MVNSITPGLGPFSQTMGALRDPAAARVSSSSPEPLRDRVSLSADSEPGMAADRAALLQARAGLDLAMAAGRQSLSLLGEISDLAARAAQPDTPDAARAVQDQAFRGLLSRLSEVVSNALQNGARALAGEAVRVGADGAAVDGLDLRLGQNGGAVSLTARSSLGSQPDASIALSDARESFSRVSVGLARLEAASANFDVHLGALAALDKSLAARVQTSLDEDSARLMALQVRQTLAGLEQPIAPIGGGVLAHFRG
jgi:hypothetical protein